VNVGTLTSKGEIYISSPVVKGMSAKRVTYVRRKDAIPAETLMTPAVKEINAAKGARAGLMECVRPVVDTTSDVVRTMAATRVLPAPPMRNATSAECTICPVVKGISARNGLPVVRMASVIPVGVMRRLVVKKLCAGEVMRVEQMGNVNHVEATTNHAV